MFNAFVRLKQARKKTNITLSDMAYLIGVDESNLSKYERGKKNPTTRVVLCYNIIAKVPLEAIYENQRDTLSDVLKYRLKNLLEDLESEPSTRWMRSRTEALGFALQHLEDLEVNDQSEYGC